MNTKRIASVLVFFGGLLIATSAHAQLAIAEDGVTLPGDKEPVWALKQYAIGDRGPAGGFVFYVTADGLHGLEAAPEDQSVGSVWGCQGTEIAWADGIGTGTGASNTEAILQGCPPNPPADAIAARLAAEYVSPSGYFDWYLPSENELMLMHDNLHAKGTGLFENDGYWSSTEVSAVIAINHDFFTNISEGFIKDAEGGRHVRAIRSY